MNSLTARLLLAASLVLVAFFALTGIAIDQAYRQSAEQAQRERLQAYAYTLIAATSQPALEQGPRLDNALPLPALFTPGSSLFGQLAHQDGRIVWLSPSARGQALRIPAGLRRTEQKLVNYQDRHRQLAVFSVGVAWSDDSEIYIVSVAEERAALAGQIRAFRYLLWGWLVAVGVLLLVVQILILRWGLAPLRKVAAELTSIEKGQQSLLSGDYPRELRVLTDNLNQLLVSEREHRQRYRDALSDLAHSLKTPLAVMQTTLESCADDQVRDSLAEPMQRMGEIIAYRLQRAVSSGPSALAVAVPAAPVVGKIVAALDKVYAGKGVECRLDVQGEALFYGDEGDLMELLGNLLDNAYHWCRHRISVGLQGLPSEARLPGLRITIADDGDGVDPDQAELILARGVTDDAGNGHGIGLALVQDIVALYDGQIDIARGPEGGLLIEISFPGRD